MEPGGWCDVGDHARAVTEDKAASLQDADYWRLHAGHRRPGAPAGMEVRAGPRWGAAVSGS